MREFFWGVVPIGHHHPWDFYRGEGGVKLFHFLYICPVAQPNRAIEVELNKKQGDASHVDHHRRDVLWFLGLRLDLVVTGGRSCI